MSSMDGFLGKVVTDAVNNAVTSDRIGDGLRLIGQRQINIEQQKHLTNNQDYIRELEQEIANLRSKNSKLEQQSRASINAHKPINMRLRGEVHLDPIERQQLIDKGIPFKIELTYEENLLEYERNQNLRYKSLLSQPMQTIAENSKDFKKTYEEQQTLLADWMVSQKAFKEIAIQFGKQLGKTPEQVIEMGMDKKIDVLEDKNDPSHRTNVGDSQEIGPRREVLLEKALKDKAARKAKKGS